MKYGNYEFEMTCEACPEQYDVLRNGVKVAYIRLRHGMLTCEHEETNDLVYFKEFHDGRGSFNSGDERYHYLNDIAVELEEYESFDD